VNSYYDGLGYDHWADPITGRSKIMALVNTTDNGGVCYRAHIQNEGWGQAVCDNSVAGTVGQGLRAEAVQIWSNREGVKMCYQAHVQNIGWQAEVCDGDVAGTMGQGLRVEAIRVRVAAAPTTTNVYYSAQIQDIGWQNEVSNNAIAGTVGQGKRLEALRVRLAP
jgi:uncharacterized protein YjdB